VVGGAAGRISLGRIGAAFGKVGVAPVEAGVAASGADGAVVWTGSGAVLSVAANAPPASIRVNTAMDADWINLFFVTKGSRQNSQMLTRAPNFNASLQSMVPG
jgi:isoaspartyl peptidase/L-asparaginase-like protein (Ntn-hydrolase superfamily)